MLNRNYLQSIIVLLWSAFLLVGFSACTTLGYENIDTTRKAIVVASAEVRAINLLLQDLIERQAISETQAIQAHGNLQQAKDYLQMALNAINLSGDPVSAGTNLQRANVAISLVLTLLAPLAEN